MSEQQRDRKILAKEEYDAALSNKTGAPARFYRAERNYHRLHDKMPQLNKILKKRHSEEADGIVDGWDTIFNDYYEDIESLINYYESQYAYVPQLKDMNVIYKEKNKTLYSDLKKAVNKSNIDIRLTNYYNDTSDYQRIINEYLKVFYWIIFAVFIIMFIFMGGWRNIKNVCFYNNFNCFPYIFDKSFDRFCFF